MSHSIRFYLSCSICFLFVNLLKTINIVLLMVNFGTYQFWFSHLVKIHVNDFLNSSILSTSALEYRLAWLYVRIINCLLAFGRSSYSVSDSLLGATLRFLLIGERCFYEILNFWLHNRDGVLWLSNRASQLTKTRISFKSNSHWSLNSFFLLFLRAAQCSLHEAPFRSFVWWFGDLFI